MISKNRNNLFFILLIVIIPVLISVMMYLHRYTGHTTQQGIFIHPAISLPIAKANPTPWQILWVSSKPCDHQCTLSIKHLKQILNVHQTEPHRVSATIWVPQKHSKGWSKAVARSNLRAVILKTDQTEINHFLKHCSPSSDSTAAIIDPNHLVPLYYPQHDWPIRLNKDLTKLMKQSQMG